MSNTTLNAFLPFLATILAAIITGVFQILVAYMKAPRKKKPTCLHILSRLKWWITIATTSVVAIIVTTFIFVTVYNSTNCAVTSSNWIPYNNDRAGSTITVSPVLGSNCAIQISFDLKQGGYVAIYKKLGPELMTWTEGIEFSYSGMGNPNTIEFKLLDARDTPYQAVWHRSTDTGGQTLSRSIPYGTLTGQNGRIFKRNSFVLDRIDFTFSNWLGDVPGSGNMVIDNIRVILSWKIWLLIFSPLLVIGIIVAYSLWQKRIKGR